VLKRYVPKFVQMVKDTVQRNYYTPPDSEMEMYWWDNCAPKWQSRVGRAKLVNHEAATRASELLDSISLAAYPNDLDMKDLIRDARDAADALCRAIARDNWDRMEGKK